MIVTDKQIDEIMQFLRRDNACNLPIPKTYTITCQVIAEWIHETKCLLLMGGYDVTVVHKVTLGRCPDYIEIRVKS